MGPSRIFGRRFFTKLLSSPHSLSLTGTRKNADFTSLFLSSERNQRHLEDASRSQGSCYSTMHGTQGMENKEDNNSAKEKQKSNKDCELICKLLSEMPKTSNIESILDNSGVKEISPMIVSEVLKKLSNAGVLAIGFFRWAEKQQGFEYTTETYNALIDSLGKIKQFKLIWVLVDSMKKKGLLTKYTFNLIVRRYARARRVEEAMETFERMKKMGFPIELSDLNRFLDTMCKSRQVKIAHQVFDEMKMKGFKVDQKSYTILLEGWGQQQNLLKLDEVYREMKEEGLEPDVVAYGILMNAYCKARKVSKAVELFMEMEAKGVEPSQHIFCILINGLGSDKRLGEALKFFEMAKANGVVPEAPTYNAVVGSFCWSMRFDDAFRVVDEMKKVGVGPNIRTYDILLHHLIKAGKEDKAYSIFLRICNDGGCRPTVSTYEIMIRMFCSKGDVNMASQVWSEMKGKGILPGMHLFATLINSFRHAHKLDDACQFVEEMMAVGMRPPASVFFPLKQALINEGNKDMALRLAKKLDAIRGTPIAS